MIRVVRVGSAMPITVTKLYHCRLNISRRPISLNSLIKHVKNITADFIIPLACIVGAPACESDPVAARTTNLEGVELILKLRDKSQKIIFQIQTAAIAEDKEELFIATRQRRLIRFLSMGSLKLKRRKDCSRRGTL